MTRAVVAALLYCDQPGGTDMKAKGNIEWIVKNRVKVQKTCLRLHRVLDTSEVDADEELTVVGLLAVGVAFSLWRAVFLVHERIDLKTNLTSAKQYLEKVIRTNNVTWTFDETRNDWVFGYYINNAILRLRLMPDRCERIGPVICGMPEFKSLLDIQVTRGNPAHGWEDCHRCLKAVCKWLERSISKDA